MFRKPLALICIISVFSSLEIFHFLAAIAAQTYSGFFANIACCRKKNKNVIHLCLAYRPRPTASCGTQDLGQSFSQYGPPAWWITYVPDTQKSQKDPFSFEELRKIIVLACPACCSWLGFRQWISSYFFTIRCGSQCEVLEWVDNHLGLTCLWLTTTKTIHLLHCTINQGEGMAGGRLFDDRCSF